MQYQDLLVFCNSCYDIVIIITADADVLQQRPTLQLLAKFVVPCVAPNWYFLGVLLGVPIIALDTIDREEKELRKACIKMFARWFDEGADQQCSWKHMLEAVAELSGIGVSNNIERKVIEHLSQEQQRGENDLHSVSYNNIIV